MSKKKLYTKNSIIYSTDANFKPEDTVEEIITQPADQQRLKVRLDAKHRAGKSVTIVEGFIGSAADAEQLCRQLKSHCATGGSVKNNEIIIQGDNREKIVQWLIKEGYKSTKKI